MEKKRKKEIKGARNGLTELWKIGFNRAVSNCNLNINRCDVEIQDIGFFFALIINGN